MVEQEVIQKTALYKDLDNSSVLKVRLDTNPLLEQFQIYLTGQIQIVAYDKNNKPFIKVEQISDPKANGEGRQWLLNKLRLIVNPSTVQGNFINEGMYYNFIFRVHSSLIKNLMENLDVWEIKSQDYEPIIDNFMEVVETFMTRPLGNKERESYAQTMRVAESSTIDQRRQGFSLNPFKGN